MGFAMLLPRGVAVKPQDADSAAAGRPSPPGGGVEGFAAYSAVMATSSDRTDGVEPQDRTGPRLRTALDRIPTYVPGRPAAAAPGLTSYKISSN